MDDEVLKRITSRDEAIKLVKKCCRAKKAIHIYVHQEAPIIDKPDRIYPITATVRVSRKNAIKFLMDGYSDIMVGKGALVTTREYDNILFIG